MIRRRSSIRFDPKPEVLELAPIPDVLNGSLYYSRSEICQFRETERNRCGKIMTKSIQSRILEKSPRKKTKSLLRTSNTITLASATVESPRKKKKSLSRTNNKITLSPAVTAAAAVALKKHSLSAQQGDKKSRAGLRRSRLLKALSGLEDI